MREVTITSITARAKGCDRYAYDRESKVSVSEEHFTGEEARGIITAFVGAALAKGLEIDTSSTTKEIPQDVEESFKVKYEQASKTISDGYTERRKKDEEIKKLQATVEALKSVCPTTHGNVAEQIMAIQNDSELSDEEKAAKILELVPDQDA